MNPEKMVFSIITPSYNMLDYLRLNAASVADQAGTNNEPTIEHIVVDGGSDDGTAEWLADQTKRVPHIKSIIEPDDGMYDAVNKGLKKAKGEILAYLNCDEQYLPGTLEKVKHYFDTHPRTDILFGDLILIRPDGTPVAFRKGYRPRWTYILTSHLYVLTCTMFIRRRIIDRGYFFDTAYRSVGDAEYVVRLLRNGYRARHIKHYFSAFTVTGQNLSADEISTREFQKLAQTAPPHIRAAKIPLNLLRLTEKCLSGAYFQKKPLQYAIYTNNPNNQSNKPNKQPDPMGRKVFSYENPSFRWQFE